MHPKEDELSLYYRQKYPLTFGDGANEPGLSSRYAKAWDVAKKISQLLKEKFGARKVVVFGSLVDPERFTRWSDIDVAAWGIPDSRFFAAVAAVIDLGSEFKVDLVDPDTCRDSLREKIECEGTQL